MNAYVRQSCCILVLLHALIRSCDLLTCCPRRIASHRTQEGENDTSPPLSHAVLSTNLASPSMVTLPCSTLIAPAFRETVVIGLQTRLDIKTWHARIFCSRKSLRTRYVQAGVRHTNKPSEIGQTPLKKHRRRRRFRTGNMVS